MTRTTSNRLSLHYGGQAFVVDAKAAACLIGRDSDCIIKVQHRLVSRRHASIEYGSGRFFLQDHSTNGTYIDDGDGGRLALVQREIYQLKGQGVISLGVEPKANPYNLIRFMTAE
jgi:pSer/pThr/pTyr-binding forkhead associated (FHA) protein